MKAANTTVIIITHRIGILAATNKIAILQGGALRANGDSEEIFEKYVSQPQVESPERRQTIQADGPETARSLQPATRLAPIRRKRIRDLSAQGEGAKS